MQHVEQPLFGNSNVIQKTESDSRINDSWVVMIVDDEQGVHDITTLALRKFIFQGKKLSFLHAYNSSEAKEMIVSHPETALMLLDVVMDTDDAGLNVAEYVRDEARNSFVRIILRTGQPGMAPESKVIQEYDINDYKDKTELTAQKLTTTMYASLRSYRDILALDQSRKGLERVIHSTSALFQTSGLDEFVSGLLLQIASVLDLRQDVLLATSSSFVAGGEEDGPIQCGTSRVLAGTGRFKSDGGKCVSELVRDEDLDLIKRAVEQKRTLCEHGQCVFYFNNKVGAFGFVYLTGCHEFNEIDERLLDMFCTNTSIAYENVSLYGEIEDTQREVIYTLGSVAEFRSKETSLHVKRVAAFSELLALKVGMSKAEANLLRLASPMHDIGKVGIPDNILNKPGKLTDEEYDIMKTHTQIGYEMLQGSERPLLKTAAIVALQHQEKWDGSGYPRGLSGEDIHIYGRISAVADVFDALSYKRCYKEAWGLEEVEAFFKEQRGKHFDPVLTDILLDNMDEFQRIRYFYDDKVSQ